MVLSCNSEWPYEVTETTKGTSNDCSEIYVAIANGRIRSLKHQHLTHPIAISYGCNSEWPYEVTETKMA